MTFVSASQFHVHVLLHSVLNVNVNVLVGAFNQEMALVGALSVIVKTDGSFAALLISSLCLVPPRLLSGLQLPN